MTDTDNISIEVPGSVREILGTIRKAGYEAYIVGGCVRDSILGKVPDDWDITTSALPEQVKSLFHATADTGIQHGTVMVIMKGQGYEVTTYRVDGEYKDGRHPESVTFTPSLEEDLKRRDFTINAFAYNPETGIVDLFNGLEDLKNGIIRAVGDPMKRFDEDALRIMRAVRFAAQLSFRIESGTLNAIAKFAERLSLVSAERIRVEFEKTLFSANPSYVNKFKELGLAPFAVPGFADDCFLRRADVVWDNIGGKPACTDEEKHLRLAAFFMGMKPEKCSDVMRKMTFDNKSRESVCAVLKFKDREITPCGAGVRKAICEMGNDIFPMVLDLNTALGKSASAIRKVYGDVLQRGQATSIQMLDITGKDLIEAGIPEGAEVGKMLKHLLDEVLEDPELNKKDILLNMIRR